MQKTIEKTRVVAELDGKYWGIEYKDGHSTSYNFGSIENAEMSDPEYCKKPEDNTWNPNRPEQGSRYNPDYEILKKAKLRTVKITTVYEIEDAPQNTKEQNGHIANSRSSKRVRFPRAADVGCDFALKFIVKAAL